MSNISVENILGYEVVREGIARCVDSVAEWIDQGDGCRWLACLNPHSYVVSLSDETFSRALRNADWLIPDGAGIVLASRFQNGVIKDRVTGSDIFAAVHERLNRTGGSVFFFGATEETLAEIRRRMATDYPNVRVVGTYSPPFKATYTREENEAMLAAINAVTPDVLWVGMTAPKQEKWIFEHRAELQVKFAGAVGAVFDFYTGKVKRSHPIFQRLGLEWLPRLIQEPRRLWRRNFVSTPKFLWLVLSQRLRGSKRLSAKEQ